VTSDIVSSIVMVGLLSAWVVLILHRANASRRRRRQLLGGIQPEGQVRRVAKRRLTERAAVVFFLMTLLLGWLWTGSRPSAFLEWVVFVGLAAMKAALFTVLFYAASDYVLDRILPEDRGPSAAQDQGRE
jgi:hypothetical protein